MLKKICGICAIFAVRREAQRLSQVSSVHLLKALLLPF